MTIIFDDAPNGGYILWRDSRGSLCVSRPAFVFPDDAAFLRMADAAIASLRPVLEVNPKGSKTPRSSRH